MRQEDEEKDQKEAKDAKVLALMNATGFECIQINGQRKCGPPHKWFGSRPPKGCEVFVGNIPRDCFEDELVPLFAQVGIIYEFRLMMDFSGLNRGYAFCMYTNVLDASRAIKLLNNYELRPKKRIGVVESIDNCKLFIGGIPFHKSAQEVIQEMSSVTDGVVNAIVYTNPEQKNRGFAFVEYESHRDAAMARRKLLPGKILLWGIQTSVDWAIPKHKQNHDKKPNRIIRMSQF